MTPRRRTLRRLLAVAVVVNVAAMSILLLQLNERIFNVSKIGKDNPLWVVSQLQFETQRLHLAASQYALGELPGAQLQRRVDILWSRLNVFDGSYVASVLREESIDTSVVDDLRLWLNTLEQRYLSSGDSQPSNTDLDGLSNAILEDMRGRSRQLHQFSLNAAKTDTMEAQYLQENLTNISFWLNILSLIALGLLGVFGTFLWVDAARSRATAREMQSLAKDATASLRAKDNFISIVSHELRTPLTSIYGSISLLKEQAKGVLSETQEQLIAMADRNCNILIKLVNDILDIEKLDGGIAKIETSNIDLSKAVLEAVENNRSYAERLEVTLDAEEVEPNLTVNAEESRIIQVLSNLISNACKFSSAQDRVKIVALSDGGSARVEVRDEGQGIPEAEQEKIFERFFQGSQTTNTTLKGTGLGLSISKKIMELHDGGIGFVSEVGSGTVFWIELDLVE